MKVVPEVVQYLRNMSPVWKDLLNGKRQFIINWKLITENGKLYLISERSEKVDLLLENVKKINVKYEETLSKSIYLVLDKYNDLSMYYFENNVLIKTKLYKGNLNDFYYIKTH